MFYAKDSKQLVFDLIAQDNPGIVPRLDSTNCVVEKITTVTSNAASNFRNTQARVRGIQGNGQSGSFIVYYNRIQIQQVILPNDFFSGNRILILNYSVSSLHNALPLLNAMSGVNLNTWDVTNVAFGGVNVADYNNYATLTITPTSPAYIGAIPLRYNRGKPTLTDQITNRNLAQYQHFDADAASVAAGQRSAAMCTYGIDFSDNANLLTTTTSGFTQWAALRQLLDSLGVPQYDAPASANQISDVTTASNQYADKQYDRVVIVTGVLSATCKGTAFYHYNT